MESAINTVRNYFKKKSAVECDGVNVPQIGFKVSFSESTKELKVKVIGARQLPIEIGNSKPRGYLVKVTVYPQKAKFETKVATGNWPTINEEFTCQLILPTKRIEDTFKGTFVCFTIYAIVGRIDEEKPVQQSKGILKRYLSYNDTPDEIISTTASARRSSMDNSLRRSSTTNALNSRRTIGAVPYTLERKIFTQKFRNDVIGTPDIWRNITEIKSGIQTQPRDGTKGSIEITLQYGLSEDGTNDVVEVTVTKFRCSLQTMHGHEKVGGQLYIKITAFEQEDLIQKMKSDKFDPTISLKLEASSSTLRATVNKYNLNQMKILIRLMAKNVLGTKVLLGKIEINSKHHFFKEIISSPAIPITKMVNFE